MRRQTRHWMAATPSTSTRSIILFNIDSYSCSPARDYVRWQRFSSGRSCCKSSFWFPAGVASRTAMPLHFQSSTFQFLSGLLEERGKHTKQQVHPRRHSHVLIQYFLCEAGLLIPPYYIVKGRSAPACLACQQKCRQHSDYRLACHKYNKTVYFDPRG